MANLDPLSECAWRGDIYVLIRFSRVRLFVIPWTVAHQAPLSMDSPGKNTGVARPSSSRSPNPGIRHSFCLPALAGGFLTTSATWEAPAEELLLQFTFFIRLVALVVPRQVSLHPQSSNDICNRIQSIFHFFFQDCCCCCC